MPALHRECAAERKRETERQRQKSSKSKLSKKMKHFLKGAYHSARKVKGGYPPQPKMCTV